MTPNSRKKLIESIIYFSHGTKGCGKLKLFKLLYLLDFEHYKQTGRSVTGLQYSAWDMGPVPRILYDEWLYPEEDLAVAVAVEPEAVAGRVREKVVGQREPDMSVFTPREKRILAEVAAQYRDRLTADMISATHADGSPWHRTWRGGEGKNEHIAYDLALVGLEPEAIAAIEEHNEFIESSHSG